MGAFEIALEGLYGDHCESIIGVQEWVGRDSFVYNVLSDCFGGILLRRF